MQLPVDVKALVDEATDIKAARDMQLSVSVYIDESAPDDLVAHVRSAYASPSSRVRMTVTYLDSSFIPHPTDDLAVVIAGSSSRPGPCAKAVRAVGVPVMVVTTSPASITANAQDANASIPDGDVLSPAEAEGAAEPIALDAEASSRLDERMGAWIVSVCHDKRLALSIAFPFMRRALARDAVQATALQNAGIGAIPFIPGADLPLMTLNQAKMALQIAAAYGHEMDKDRWKELAAVIGGAYLSRTLARELVEFVPVLGFVVRTGIAYGSTSAIGHAIIEYYEGGEDATGVANVVEKAGEAGANALARARAVIADPSSIDLSKASNAVDVVVDRAVRSVPQVVELAGEYAPKAKEVLSGVLSKVVSR